MLRRYGMEKNKYKLPQIIIDDNNEKKNDHFVSEEDKKIKKITLSSYNSYIKDYTKSLKYPSSNYYSTDKLKHSIAFNNLNDINLNKKLNFLSTFSEFNLNKKTSIFKTNINNNNDINNRIRLISYANIDIQHIKFLDTKYHKHKTDEEILQYFIEGSFLRKPEHLKYIGIKEKNMYPHLLNENDFDFYSKYLENINKNENLTDYKQKTYQLNSSFNHHQLNFVLELKSICFQFEEININNISKDTDENQQSISTSYNINENIKGLHNLYFPFKYLPLLYLLDYSNFKSFISEIVYFAYENNKFNFIGKEDFEDIIKKYSELCKNKLNYYNKEKNFQILKNCIYYENEFHYNNEFFWLIYDDDNNETKVFRLQIIFPLIDFQITDLNIKFKRYCNKWLLLELVKENFNSWDRYLLFTLFINKFMRKSISEILNRKKGFTSFLNKSQFIGPLINSYYYKKNNFDFFLTEINLNINHYFFISPYHISISKKSYDKYEINDSIYLQLNNARKIYKLSEFYGLMGIFNKCMFYNKYKKKFYFSLKFLEDIDDDYISFLKEQKKQFVNANNETKNIFKYNGNEYHLIIRDCLLCERRFDIMNHDDNKYFNIPEKLYEFILGNDMNDEKEVISNLIKHIIEIINSSEIETKSLSITKTKSLKSLKSNKRKEASSFKGAGFFFNNNYKNFSKLKTTNFKVDKKFEKDNSSATLDKKQMNSFKNVRISYDKQK